MLKGKRRRSGSSTQVLDDKDLKKIQKLIEANKEEDEDFEKKSKILIDVDISAIKNEDKNKKINDSLFNDEDQTMSIELGEEWNAFYKGSKKDGKDYVLDYQKKLKDCESEIGDAMSEYVGSIPGDLNAFTNAEALDELPVELRDHLKLLIDVLKHYRSGPLPKTVKMLPHLPGWDGLLEMLKPLEWTVHAHQRVVKVFTAKGNEQALHYFENYLLPKVQENIQENLRLDMHLFEALISAMFRPEEFVAGIFSPWIKSEMSKTEGIVLANLMKRASLKARFAAVALALLVKEDFSISRSTVLESILNKKYRLPEGAINCLIKYFISFDTDAAKRYFVPEGYLPVTWFRALLSFLELYRDAINADERDALFRLCRRHQHPGITSELRSLLNLVNPLTAS